MNPFLTYELLTPENTDPVIIRITSQRERGFEDFRASNGVRIACQGSPRYYPLENALYTQGVCEHMDDRRVEIPLADWPLVEAAIEELNEAKKEKDMKEDRYEFDPREWSIDRSYEGHFIVLTRKKPKVKVESRSWNLCEEAHDFGKEYGVYYLVQFRVRGWDWEPAREQDLRARSLEARFELRLSSFDKTFSREWRHVRTEVYLGLDARDKWSTPILLPEGIYAKLPEICRALEDMANGGKG